MTHRKQNKLVNTGNLYTEILRWAYSKKVNGFSEQELFEKFGLDKNEKLKNWYLHIFRGGVNNDECLIGLFDYKDDVHFCGLTAKGLSVAIDYISLEESRENSINANKQAIRAFWVSVFTILLGVGAIYLQIQSNNLTREEIEVSAPPVLSISLDRRNIPEGSDEVFIAAGFLPAKDSVLKLNLRNSSLSAIEQVDMRMTLWKYFVDKESHHLTVCPLGYVDNKNNPNFIVSSLSTENVLDHAPSKKFLHKDQEYPFTVDFSSLDNTRLIPEGSRILLKIDVNFVKSASQTRHSYIKLYTLYSFGGDVLDIDVAPEYAIALTDKKNEKKDADGFKFPAAVYPFKEEEFLKYFEHSTYKLDLLPSSCREFTLLKEQKVISY